MNRQVFYITYILFFFIDDTNVALPANRPALALTGLFDFHNLKVKARFVRYLQEQARDQILIAIIFKEIFYLLQPHQPRGSDRKPDESDGK